MFLSFISCLFLSVSKVAPRVVQYREQFAQVWCSFLPQKKNQYFPRLYHLLEFYFTHYISRGSNVSFFAAFNDSYSEKRPQAGFEPGTWTTAQKIRKIVALDCSAMDPLMFCICIPLSLFISSFHLREMGLSKVVSWPWKGGESR